MDDHQATIFPSGTPKELMKAYHERRGPNPGVVQDDNYRNPSSKYGSTGTVGRDFGESAAAARCTQDFDDLEDAWTQYSELQETSMTGRGIPTARSSAQYADRHSGDARTRGRHRPIALKDSSKNSTLSGRGRSRERTSFGHSPLKASFNDRSQDSTHLDGRDSSMTRFINMRE
ncbi:MAG: hypothetical protein Q9162_006593 [Coniocarpon cinnabarinum]